MKKWMELAVFVCFVMFYHFIMANINKMEWSLPVGTAQLLPILLLQAVTLHYKGSMT